MSNPSFVLLNILGKEFKVACSQEEKPALLASAKFLSEKLNVLRGRGKAIANDRLAITVALNITHELLECQQQLKNKSSRDFTALQQKIDQALN